MTNPPTISGFTFLRNVTKLHLPAKEAIASVLPFVDEFVVTLDRGDDDDQTEALLESMKSDKIKIVHTEWDVENFPQNTVYARETDKAKDACTGDWLFYIQGDEALHEDYGPAVIEAISKYNDDKMVEGLLFRYLHFWGDYKHFNPSHRFYSREIRVIRNLPRIHSWRDAQSFRYYHKFDYAFADYIAKENSRKLNVARVDAEIFHYGWVRPPALMSKKIEEASKSYRGEAETKKLLKDAPGAFLYGPLNRYPEFKGTHPAVMQSWIEKFDWADQLQYSGSHPKGSKTEKHHKLKYRTLTWVEQNLLGGKKIGEFKNFRVVR